MGEAGCMRAHIIQESMFPLSDAWRRLRRRLKSGLPYVRRRVFRNLQRKYDGLADAVLAHATGAGEAPLQARQPAPPGLAGEVCLFVTHAPRPTLKSHVAHHIDHLLRAGVQVVLIVNTDLPLDAIEVDPALQRRLAGLYVRANRGFDFGAWAHVLRQCERGGWQRLYLVNDSMVGPLAPAAFDAMMARIRASTADFQGLTENPEPIPHLQSFFLVLGPRVLASALFARFVHGVLDFGDKGQVVEVYEIRLTRALRAAGFSGEPVFSLRRADGLLLDLHGRWQLLVEAGFPYVKTRVLQDAPGDPRLRAIREQGRVDAQI
jgi:lipopolysaccharide biosynthesis protein